MDTIHDLEPVIIAKAVLNGFLPISEAPNKTKILIEKYWEQQTTAYQAENLAELYNEQSRPEELLIRLAASLMIGNCKFFALDVRDLLTQPENEDLRKIYSMSDIDNLCLYIDIACEYISRRLDSGAFIDANTAIQLSQQAYRAIPRLGQQTESPIPKLN